MTGVEILAAQEVVIKSAFSWTAFVILLSVMFIIYMLIGFFISLAYDEWSNLYEGIIIGIVLGLFFGVIAGFLFDTPTAYETRYKVTISDEVLMNDFLEKYEIINQEGKIYTIRERNEVDK